MSDDVLAVLDEFSSEPARLAEEVVRLRAELARFRTRQVVPLRSRRKLKPEAQIGFRLR